jgi:hypothetical protein
MKPSVILIALVPAIVSGSVAADDPLSQKLSKAIVIESSKAGPADTSELVAVPLDSQVYAAASADLSDLRIVSTDGKTLPFLLRPRQTTEPRITRTTWRSSDLAARPVGDGRFEFQVSLDTDDPQPTHLRVVTPLTNFEQQADIYSIDENGSEPEQLVEGALLFDYSAVADVRRDTIELPGNSARHFRIEIHAMAENVESPYLQLTRNLQGGEEISRQERTQIRQRPFRVDRIEWIREETHPRIKEIVKVDWPVTMAAPVLDEERQQTVIDISTQRQPISSFVVETSSSNFSRRVLIETPESGTAIPGWHQIGSGTIQRFSFRDLEEEQLEISFPETRSSAFRLIIENRDSPPLHVSSVTARGSVHEAVFLTERELTLSLLFEAEVDAPDYDLAALQRLFNEGSEPVAAQLATQQLRLDAAPAGSSVRNILNNAFILGGLATILVVLLGAALYAAGKRIPNANDAKH